MSSICLLPILAVDYKGFTSSCQIRYRLLNVLCRCRETFLLSISSDELFLVSVDGTCVTQKGNNSIKLDADRYVVANTNLDLHHNIITIMITSSYLSRWLTLLSTSSPFRFKAARATNNLFRIHDVMMKYYFLYALSIVSKILFD